MNILSVMGAGLVAAVLSIIVKQYKPEFGIYISLASGVLILAVILTVIKPILVMITELADSAGINSVYTGILIKALAICYITQLASDTCKDSGEAAIASKLEMAGKIAVTVLSVPIFTDITRLITEMLN